MAKRVRSAKGVVVDFDLIAIKEQMASAPAPLDVKKRQDFIDRRMRRRLKKKPALRPGKVAAAVVPEAKIVENSPEGEQVAVREAPKEVETPKRKQRARPKKK